MSESKGQTKIIAVDFDGTLVESTFPGIGETRTEVLEYCKEQKASGAQIILWTNRVGDRLDEAVKWCEDNGLDLDAVNDNLPQMKEFFGNDPRKVFANEYIDDRMSTKFQFGDVTPKLPWKKVTNPLDDNFKTGRYLCWMYGVALILWYYNGGNVWIDTGWNSKYEYNKVKFCFPIEAPDGENSGWTSDERG